MLIIESDNCCNQYKSAKSFYLLQQLSNLYNVPICRIYGVAGHSKSEVDSVGGVVKIAIRNEVARGACFLDAGECVDFLHDKFQGSVDPMYSIKEIDPASLEIMRKENRYMVFPTIDGSSSFQVLIFTPNSNKFKASPYLCTCEICINIEYGSCSLFQVYELTAVDLIKRTMRSDFEPAQTSSSDVSEEENIFANGFFLQNPSVPLQLMSPPLKPSSSLEYLRMIV